MVGLIKGVVGYRQYCPRGLKSFVLADSATEYVLNIIPYTGGETKEIFLSNCDLFSPKLWWLCLRVILIRDTADRLYSSVPLVESQTPATATERRFKLQKGETKAWRNDIKSVLAWRDKGKPTFMISTAQ